MGRRAKRAENPGPRPRADCPACKGSGFVRLAAAPNRTGVDGRQVRYDPPLVRCECMKNQVKGFEEPAAPTLDQAQKAAGERED